MLSFLYYYGLALASLMLFLYGFFPVQQSQVADPVRPPTILNNVELNVSKLYKQEVDRVIVVVIDALRIDFITEENMPFLVTTYKEQGCMLSLQVESPTVTLPRIKALTTGSIPQFVDVILNLASTEILTDSILHRAVEDGKKIIFYGDDTWVKLYPNMFERYEGVSSFYVNDYTEVDNNVTRNVLTELNKTDWDIMFLHYLGLDHIGHVFGPFSHLIQPKLREMDKIIENIYLASKQWSKKSLIAVTGDHGMKDSGGHGGSTDEETHVPFVSIGIRCSPDSVSQSDIPPTLTMLMGSTLPSNNIGRVIVNMFPNFSSERLLYILYYNALTLQVKTKKYSNMFNNASFYHYKYLKTNNESDAITAKGLYISYCEKISNNLIESSVKQDVNGLLTATALLLSCVCVTFSDYIEHNINQQWTTVKIILLLILFLLQFVLPRSLILVGIYLFLVAIYVTYFLHRLLKFVVKRKLTYNIKEVVLLCTILRILSLLSSSFIEEEHQVWYFFWGTFIATTCITTVQKLTAAMQLLTLFLGLRLLRTINQTGDKWAHLPDLSDWLLLEENSIYLQAVFAISLILLWLSCFKLHKMHRNNLLLNTITIILIFFFRNYGIQSSFLGKSIWFLIFTNLGLGLLQSNRYIEQIIITWMLSCALLMRSYNIILLPACIYASLITHKYINTVDVLTVIHIWLGKIFFFLQGHSNSLASIDIASGYVGLQEYFPFVVILQVLCHTYAFPILTNLLMLKHYFLHSNKIWTVNIVSQLLVLITICILTFIQRHHLFVWTVFAPKLLIESSHSVILFIQLILFYSISFVNSVFVCFLKNVIK